MKTSLATVLITTITLTIAAPAVKYDQRQEGDVNIRADLENFVILIIPTSGTANMGLLDILSKSLPGKGLMKHNNKGENRRQSNPLLQSSPLLQSQAQHFIESKTAPYHVDISRTRSHLAKLRPPTPNSEVLIAHSPTIALSKRENSVLQESTEDNARSSRSFNVKQNEDFQALVVSSDLFVGRKNGRSEKKSVKDNKKGELKLLGAEMDQCAPDQKRDELGVCQFIKE